MLKRRVKKEYLQALQQLVALLRADPATDNYNIVNIRHIKMNPSLDIAKKWVHILKIGIINKWIHIEIKTDGAKIYLGSNAPIDSPSKIEKAAKDIVNARV